MADYKYVLVINPKGRYSKLQELLCDKRFGFVQYSHGMYMLQCTSSDMRGIYDILCESPVSCEVYLVEDYDFKFKVRNSDIHQSDRYIKNEYVNRIKKYQLHLLSN